MKHAGGRPRVEFDREGAVAAYEAGESVCAIARRIGVSAMSVFRELHRRGIKRERPVYQPKPSTHGLLKTHCKRGHPMIGENLYVRPSGGRVCKACRKLNEQDRASTLSLEDQYEALTPWEIKAMMREANARFVAALREARA